MPDYQSAYRSNYSCETALIKLVNDILCSMENTSVTALMAIDLSAAFDTVDHDVLLSVLSAKFGVVGTALSWFDSYLRPRTCTVHIGSKHSSPKEVAFSVPQGSCLGPVLFLAYSSTMHEIVPVGMDLHGFADDHALKKAFSTRANAEQNEQSTTLELENASIQIKSWMDQHRLKMNSAKTEFILFGSSAQLKKCSVNHITVNGDNVERTNMIKYLGAWMDENLTFKKHITKKCQIAAYSLHKIRCVRKYLTEDACHILVRGLVISHLDYANAILVNLPKCDINKMQRIQNMAAKVIKGKGRYDSSTETLKSLHWLPIHLRIHHKILCTVFKCMQGNAPLYLQELLVMDDMPRNMRLRSDNVVKKLKIPRTQRKTFASRSFSVVGPTMWNALPNDLKAVESLDVFKNKLKTHLYSHF